MLISEFVTTTWQRRTKTHYMNMGYEYTKINDEFIVRVNDLTHASSERVFVECDGDFCNHKLMNMTYNNYKIKAKEDGSYYCNKCAVKHFGIRKMAKTRISKTETFYDWCMSNNYKHIIDRWDYKLNDCNPNEVGAKTDRKYWFKCENGIHESEQKQINYLTQYNSINSSAINCDKCNSFGYYIEQKHGIEYLNKLWDYNLNNVDPYSIDKCSSKKAWLNCPECGSVKSTVLNNYQNRGVRCGVCNDNISVPEKFGIHLFKQLNLKAETQYSPKWANRLKYDFYINNYIIETHGEQHYKETTRGRSLKEEQENDLLKYNLAIQNGIKPENYIVIDCRKSEFKWLKENYIKALEHYLDLSNVDWSKVWEECQSSLVKKSWDVWKDMYLTHTVDEMSECVGVKKNTFKKYLKIGYDLNIINYN